MLETSYQALASAASGPTGRGCDFVASVELDDLRQERINAKHLILDGIAAPPSKALSLTDDNLSGWPRTYDDALSNEGIRSKWAMLADSVLDAEGKVKKPVD
ncbi:hypothetical protein HO133_004297 [Letharia lupina]|uniref:Uncharacterized protein n=1 Tax=Letharia lupina TaxID=560253 RepID=A0A8H6FJY6_9LECA|nr:uncharacterized protein HO133_004297 [Letharia lupina]KAF6229959.1 hypothetical protein HO133_004297 [Letharia lupina]